MEQAYKEIITGEAQGAIEEAVRFDDIPCAKVKIKAKVGNSGNVYIGGTASLTTPTGSNNTTTGYELDAGQETDWLHVDNLNKLYRICDNAGDDVLFIAVR